MLKIKNTHPPPLQQHITLNDRVIGELWETGWDWQCQIHLNRVTSKIGSVVLVGGDGKTPEAAIEKAIAEARKHAAALSEAADILEQKLKI